MPLSYTGGAMKVKPTNVTNLVRSDEGGVYYVRAKIRGKILRRSLDTTTFTVAKKARSTCSEPWIGFR